MLSTLAAVFTTALPASAETVNYNDPYAYAQYYLNDTGVASVVHGKHTKTTTVKVAVYDVGFKLDHPDLRNNFSSNAYWLSSGDTNEVGHGTCVSSVISMDINNSTGGAGVTPDVEIYPISWNSSSIKDLSRFGGNNNSLSDAVQYCINNNILILNVSSIGGYVDPALIQQYADIGGVICCGAGNDGLNRDLSGNWVSPCCYAGQYDNVISVTGSRNGKAATWTDYGVQNVTIAAPCMDILLPQSDSTYFAISGTSEASPFVAGVFALLKSYFPSATNQQIKQAIMETVDKDQTLTNRCAAGGTVNAEKALIRLEEIMNAPFTDGYYYIQNLENFKYLSYDNAASGHNVSLSSTAKKWKVELTKDGSYAVFPADNMGVSLDIWNAWMDTDTQVWQYNYNEDLCQNWYLESKTYGFQLQSAVNRSFSLGYKNNGTVIRPSSNALSQQWYFEKADDAPDELLSGSFYLKNNSNDQYITSPGDGHGVFTRFDGLCNTSASKWNIEHVGNGYYKIVAADHPDKCLEIFYASTNNDTAVWQLTYGGYDCQLWKITRKADGSYRIASKLNDSLLLNFNSAPNTEGYYDNTLCTSYVDENLFSSSWTLENAGDMLDGRQFNVGGLLGEGTIRYIGNKNYTIVNAQGNVLTIADDSSQDVNRSVSYQPFSSGNESQIWKIREINGKYYLVPYRFQCTALTTGSTNTWLTSTIEGLSLR